MHTRGTVAGTQGFIFCMHLQLQKLFAWERYHVWVGCRRSLYLCSAYMWCILAPSTDWKYAFCVWVYIWRLSKPGGWSFCWCCNAGSTHIFHHTFVSRYAPRLHRLIIPNSMEYVTIASESSGVFFYWGSTVFTSHKHLCASAVGVKDFTPVKSTPWSSLALLQQRSHFQDVMYCNFAWECDRKISYLPCLSSFVMANCVTLLFEVVRKMETWW